MQLRSSAVSVKVDERKTRMIFGTSQASSISSSQLSQCPSMIASTNPAFRSCLVAGSWMRIPGASADAVVLALGRATACTPGACVRGESAAAVDGADTTWSGALFSAESTMDAGVTVRSVTTCSHASVRGSRSLLASPPPPRPRIITCTVDSLRTPQSARDCSADSSVPPKTKRCWLGATPSRASICFFSASTLSVLMTSTAMVPLRKPRTNTCM
mmetsp:Transcript_43596/g.102956  ORF Transcript_43596/g.102956 Transcript_43596/m.102956 type:complete len:215 (-) Transcript_43596:361-1005(-)